MEKAQNNTGLCSAHDLDNIEKNNDSVQSASAVVTC